MNIGWDIEELTTYLELAHEEGGTVSFDLMDVRTGDSGFSAGPDFFGHRVELADVKAEPGSVQVTADFPASEEYVRFFDRATVEPFQVSIQVERILSTGPLVRSESGPPEFAVVGTPEVVETDAGPKLRVVLRSR